MGGEKYELLQVHFRTPSEHMIHDKCSDMEMHIVHKNEAGTLVVIGVMIDEGAASDHLKTIWDNIPHDINKEITVTGATINAAA